MATEIKVPTLGESVTEATIGKWFKKPGDAVRQDEPLVELETDKVTLEVNAPAAGVLSRHPRQGRRDGRRRRGARVDPGRRRRLHRRGAVRRRRGASRPASTRSQRPRPRHRRVAGAARPAEPRAAHAALSRRRRRSPPTVGSTRRRSRERAAAARSSRETCSSPPTSRGQQPAPPPAAPPTARRRAGRPRAGFARRRRRPRGAGAHDQAAPDDRASPEGSAGERCHADDLQRGRHDQRHGAAQPVQGIVREEARREARLHVLLREGLHPGPEGNPRRQRGDRWPGHHLQELLPHRRRRRHRQGARRPGHPRRGQAQPRRDREGDRRFRQAAPARASSRSRRCRAAPSPSRTAGSTAP